MKEVEAIPAKCKEFEVVTLQDATLQEEQERELSPENEQERQVERPSAYKPHQHHIHPHVKRLVERGILSLPSDVFQPAFGLFSKTSAARFLDTKSWPSHLLLTPDFARTIQHGPDAQLDEFLRPVHWIVSYRTRKQDYLVVLSPFEANELLPLVRRHKQVTLHIYSTRTGMSMPTLEDLSFCTIRARSVDRPSQALAMQLNLFAGQLYLKNFGDYHFLCRFLGLSSCPPKSDVQIAHDGFVAPTSRMVHNSRMIACAFSSSPVSFLRAVITMRRKG